MKTSQPKGCLFFFLQLFSPTNDSGEHEELPYRLRDDFLSPAELSFYRVLQTAIQSEAAVLVKVNLADIFFVARPNENRSYRNKIDRKHVDFLLCHPVSMQPLCGIELDDNSHSRSDRRERDAFVEQVFNVAQLPLLRVRASRSYNPRELVETLAEYLPSANAEQLVTGALVENDTPQCPKCGVSMILRQATQGKHAGKSFYGCPNFPRCRELVS